MIDNFEIDAEFVADLRVTREMVEATDDTETLLHWFNTLDERIVRMKAFLESRRDAEINDEDYFDRTAGALAYARIGQKWVERRLLTLGAHVPYPPTDPRTVEVRILQKKLEQLKKRVAELERLVVPEAEAA